MDNLDQFLDAPAETPQPVAQQGDAIDAFLDGKPKDKLDQFLDTQSPSDKAGDIEGEAMYKAYGSPEAQTEFRSGLPFGGLGTAIDQGYKHGEDIAGDGVAGKVLGTGLAAAYGAGTAFNPLMKLGGYFPRIAQASGEALGGDTEGASDTLFGQKEVLPDLQPYEAKDTGPVELTKAMLSDFYVMARKDPVNTGLVFEGLTKLGANATAARFGALDKPMPEILKKHFPDSVESYETAKIQTRQGALEQLQGLIMGRPAEPVPEAQQPEVSQLISTPQAEVAPVETQPEAVAPTQEAEPIAAPYADLEQGRARLSAISDSLEGKPKALQAQEAAEEVAQPKNPQAQEDPFELGNKGEATPILSKEQVEKIQAERLQELGRVPSIVEQLRKEERERINKKASQPAAEDLPLQPNEPVLPTRDSDPTPEGVRGGQTTEPARRLALESARSRATEDLRATLGRIGIGVKEDYSLPKPGVESHPAGAWYDADGNIGVTVYPDRIIKQASDVGHTEAGIKLIQDQHGEELIHAANLIALRDEWTKGAKHTVDFETYVDRSMEHIVNSISNLSDEFRANGESAKAELLEKRAIASGNLYYADLEKTAPRFDSFSSLLEHLEKNQDEIPKFAAEMVRQHVEARETGLTTDVGYKRLIKKLQQWVEESLAVLKKAALGSEFGEMGKPLQIAIEKTEATLKGIREGTLKSTSEGGPGTKGKSFFTRLPESSDQNPLSGLSKEVEEAAKTSESLPSRISTARRIAARYYDAKDAVGNAVISARSGFSTMVGALKNPPKFTEFKRALGEWLGQLQRNDLELRRFSQNIKTTIPDAMRREAITNYLQAGGDLSLLKERASKSKGSLKLGYEMATQLTPREVQVAQQIRAYFDSMLKDGVDNGLLEHGVKNYVSQLWAKDNVATQQLMADIEIGKLNKNFKFAQERFYSSFFDGEQAGFKPKTKDIGAIVAAYDQAFNQSIAARAFIKQLTENGIASDKRPFVVLSGSASPVEEGTSGLFINPKAAPKHYGDYLPLDHPSLRGWKWVETDGATGKNVFLQGEARLHPEIAPHMKAVFERSAFETNTFLRVVGKPLLNIQSFIKSNMLSLSMFHLVQEGEHALGYRVNPFKVDKLDLNNPKQYSLVTHGLQVSSFHAMQEFAEGVAGGSKPLINKLPWIGEKVLQPVQDWLFHEYIPRLKMQTALKMMERNEARFGAKLSHDQLLELSASQANAAYGELNYKYIGRSATTQDVFRLVALAPDFLEARVRTVGQAFTKHGTEQRANMALLAVGTFVVARVMNKLLDDDYHTEDPFRIHAGGKVYGFRIIPEDIYSMLTQTRRFIAGRESPLVSFVHDISTGTDYRGASMSSGQIVKSQLRNMLPSGINRMRDRSIGDTLLTAGGMQVTNSTNAQQIGQQARDFNAKTGFKQDSANVFHESRFKDLKTQLQLGETEAARDEYLRLIKTENIKDFQAALRASFDPNRAFTGSKAQERAFIASLDPRQRQRYNDAVKEKKQLNNAVENLIKETSKVDIQQAMAERKKARMAEALAKK